jgi:hypothetical protein
MQLLTINQETRNNGIVKTVVQLNSALHFIISATAIVFEKVKRSMNINDFMLIGRHIPAKRFAFSVHWAP